MSQCRILDELTKRRIFMEWFKRLFKKKATKEELEMHANHIRDMLKDYSKEMRSRDNVLAIAKGKEFRTDTDAFHDLDWSNSNTLTKKECYLAGVAYPNKWEVWVKKE